MRVGCGLLTSSSRVVVTTLSLLYRFSIALLSLFYRLYSCIPLPAKLSTGKSVHNLQLLIYSFHLDLIKAGFSWCEASALTGFYSMSRNTSKKQ